MFRQFVSARKPAKFSSIIPEFPVGSWNFQKLQELAGEADVVVTTHERVHEKKEEFGESAIRVNAAI